MTPKLLPNAPYERQKTTPRPLRNHTKNKHEKTPEKDIKKNLSQQGNGKRAQEESTVEQRNYICGIENMRRHRCKT